MWIITLLLAACVVYMAIRLCQLRSTLGRISTALESGKPFLFTLRAQWARNYHIEALSRQINAVAAEREKSSRKQRSYLHQLETTLGNLAEAVFVVDDSGRLYAANPAARKLFGITGNVEGQKIESVIQSARFLEFMRRVRYGTTPGRGQIEMSSGRQTLFLEVAGARIPETSEDAPELTLFVLHDVTNLKRLENVRKEFVANVSHELRTPVTIIKGYSDTLLEDYYQLEDKDRLRFIEKINRNVGRLHLLLEDLLILSRLEWATEALQREACSFRKLVNEAVDNIQSRLDPRTQRVVLDLEASSDLLALDVVKIGQVLQNLLDNIIRYAKGFTEITITSRKVDDTLKVSVSDDGCGIPESDLEHVFERFYRVDKGRSRELGGTGLGLSIVKHILQLHGGTIQANSRLGEGTEITFTLPIVDLDADPPLEDLSDPEVVLDSTDISRTQTTA